MTEPSSSSDMLIEDRGAVRLLTLNRPSKKNAITMPMWGQLADALDNARNDAAVRCMVITGAGGNFCSGTDISSFSAEGEVENLFPRCLEAFEAFDKPLIAAVEGIAVGGGATIPLHADIVYVGDNLRMRFPFVSLGVVPEFAASYMLPQVIGQQRAAELLLTADWLDADKAVELGLARESVAADNVLEHALQRAADIAQWSTASLQATKQCMLATRREMVARTNEIEQELMMQRVGSAENIEAVTALLEKRPPKF